MLGCEGITCTWVWEDGIYKHKKTKKEQFSIFWFTQTNSLNCKALGSKQILIILQFLIFQFNQICFIATLKQNEFLAFEDFLFLLLYTQFICTHNFFSSKHK